MMKTLFFFFVIFSTHALMAKTLIYCSEGSPSAFNPQIFTDGTSSNASTYTLYNRLVEFKPGTTEVLPALAKSYEISKNQLTYTFHLREKVSFHKTTYFTPTRDFNGEDVLFSFNRQRQKDHPFHKVGGGSYEYFDGMDMGKIIQDIKLSADKMTVTITLSKPNAPFLANMAMSFMSILSAEYGDKLTKENKKENIDQFPIGTGPFVFVSYAKDSAIKFTKNEHYFLNTKSNIDKLIFAITPDPSVRTQKLKVSECQFIAEPNPTDLIDLKKNPKMTIVSAEGMNVGYLAMNVTKKPFDNPLIRKALGLALNRQSYIDPIYVGNARLAKGPLPPTIWSFDQTQKDLEFNREMAKNLLKKAGFPNGFETEMWTLPVSRPYNPNGKKMGELMQADLALVGIKVKLLTFDWPTYLKKSKEGGHQLIQFGWTGDNGDPDNFLGTLLSCDAVGEGSNYARWCHKEFNDLIVKAREETNLKKRTTYYKKAQQIFREELPWIPLFHSVQTRAFDKNIKGYKLDPLGHDIFTFVTL